MEGKNNLKRFMAEEWGVSSMGIDSPIASILNITFNRFLMFFSASSSV
jgi:hypothetical protein